MLTQIPERVVVASGLHVVGDFTAEVDVSSGLHVQISGQHIYQESGAFVTAHLGAPVLINTLYSGVVEVISGLHVWISGQHVFVESGVHVIGDFTAEVDVSSGLHVQISGQHVFVESGIYVTTQPEIAVSGTVSVQSGVYLASGIHVITTAGSGQHVQISGQHVFVESGVHIVGDFTAEVDVSSGLHVQISGQHVFVESGAHIVVGSGLGVIGDFTTEVASGLYVVQSLETQLNNYFISDIDESDSGIQYYGYLDAGGNGYIMRNTSGTTYRYASSGFYTSNWIDRSGIIYQTFDKEF